MSETPTIPAPPADTITPVLALLRELGIIGALSALAYAFSVSQIEDAPTFAGMALGGLVMFITPRQVQGKLPQGTGILFGIGGALIAQAVVA